MHSHLEMFVVPNFLRGGHGLPGLCGGRQGGRDGQHVHQVHLGRRRASGERHLGERGDQDRLQERCFFTRK